MFFSFENIFLTGFGSPWHCMFYNHCNKHILPDGFGRLASWVIAVVVARWGRPSWIRLLLDIGRCVSRVMMVDNCSVLNVCCMPIYALHALFLQTHGPHHGKKSAFEHVQNEEIQIILRMRNVSGSVLSIHTFCRIQWLFSDSEGPDQTARMRMLI